MARPVEVLPQPLSPTRPSVSPRRTSKLTPSTALIASAPVAQEQAAPHAEVDLEVLDAQDVVTGPSRSRVSGRRHRVHATPSNSQEHACACVGTAPARGSAGCPGLMSKWQAARWRWPTSRNDGRLDVALALDGIVAARREGAALHQLGDVGRAAADRRQLPLVDIVEARDRAQEADGVGHARVLQNVARGALLDHAAGVHHHHPVGHAGDDAEVVGDHDHRHAELALQPAR